MLTATLSAASTFDFGGDCHIIQIYIRLAFVMNRN